MLRILSNDHKRTKMMKISLSEIAFSLKNLFAPKQLQILHSSLWIANIKLLKISKEIVQCNP